MEEFTRKEVLDMVKTIVRIFTEKPKGKDHFDELTGQLPSSVRDEILATIAAAMMMQLMRGVADGDIALHNTHRNLFSES